ncbi:MAG TPA: phosphoribosyltransferase family protein, partial [Phycisphaerales bacterium]|nr:phosphoribosyltransferase family protein [Phycisphaerales bacterium]
GSEEVQLDETAPPPPERAPLAKPVKFHWPPRQIGASTPDLPGPSAQPDIALTPWEAFEREWFGVTTPPLARRLADAGAAPDRLDAFCWRCARTVGPYETDAKGCSHCRGRRPPWNRFVRLAEYAPPWDRIVQDAKFTRWPRLSRDLGRVLGRQLAAAVPDLADRPTVVVPVPTSLWRRMERGTDHSLNLARGVVRELRLPLRKLLVRSNRPEQAGLSQSDRQTNLTGSMGRSRLDRLCAAVGWGAAYRWPGTRGGRGARLIVVDDISTTGATMNETCRALRDACKPLSIKDLEIVCGVVCRTEEHR